VWLDDLNVTQAIDPNAKNFGSVRASGHSGSDKFAQVANFLEDLETSAFVDDFEKPSPPEGTQTLVDETLVPPVAWAFPMQLSLKGPEERAKSEAARLAKNRKDAPLDPSDAQPATARNRHGNATEGSTDDKKTTTPPSAPSDAQKPGDTTKPAEAKKPGTEERR
jgi:hypothetical protein